MAGNRMLSIWFFVGLMLSIFGGIVTLTGIGYLFHPQTQTEVVRVHEHVWWGLANPNIWWGGIMLAAGLIFLIPAYLHYRSAKEQ
jgi:hypothetical protein